MKARALFAWLLVGLVSFPAFSDRPTGASIDVHSFYYSLPTAILSFKVISDSSEVSSSKIIEEIVQSLKNSLPEKTIAVTRQFVDEMGTNGLDVNMGIDISLAAGTPIFAPAKAFIETTGYDDDFGNFVVLNHGNDLYTIYGYLAAVTVRKRDFVEKGQQIAWSGATGLAAAPILRFALRDAGIYWDPLVFLEASKN